jgi:DNA-binding NarL/FixJ family response regulator
MLADAKESLMNLETNYTVDGNAREFRIGLSEKRTARQWERQWADKQNAACLHPGTPAILEGLLLNKIILADNQTVFRAGTARVLALEPDNRIVAQCDSSDRLRQAVESFPGCIVILASALLNVDGHAAIDELTTRTAAVGSRIILIAENGEVMPQQTLLKVNGMVSRNVSGADMVNCVRRVGRGQRCILTPGNDGGQLADSVGARVRDRLTPKEMQIVALIVQGCKNKDIAQQLGTKEQVIKNYLRSIYDKTGVSDRLELALFTIHHRMLAEAATRAGNLLLQPRA